MWAWGVRPFLKVRPYRFAHERDNHERQAAETEVSLGLMALAATRGDDDHRIQAWQTEATLRARKAVLEDQRAKRGLTWEERGELESIDKGLSDLNVPAATPESVGRMPMRMFGAVGANPVAGILASPMTWMAAGLALTMGWGTITTWRLSNAKDDLREARETARDNAAAAAGWQERSEEYRLALVDAANVARHAAAALETERQSRARAAARERRRNREIANVRTGAPEPPDWRLRDDPTEGEPPAGN
jgi:hypothetical protein